ncbi:hypothetical protein [Paraburkholderia sp. J41]|uniref:hypothetical protein n=1 Tax=Paraburkholderia sp. J41 TaxID=2805433 RepID=UPI002AC35A0E|nr:hypothetical protein [Paraburkholderia sp. J41]
MLTTTITGTRTPRASRETWRAVKYSITAAGIAPCATAQSGGISSTATAWAIFSSPCRSDEKRANRYAACAIFTPVPVADSPFNGA